MDSRDISILTQVAFKGAVDLTKEINCNHEDSQQEFLDLFRFLADALVAEVTKQVEDAATAGIAKAFPNTTVEGDIPVENAQGPIPGWVISAAKKAGVSRLRDNRDKAAQNPKAPLFTAADGTKNERGYALGFWEPRG